MWHWLTFESENHNKLPFHDVVMTYDSFFKIWVHRKLFSVSIPPHHALSDYLANQKIDSFTYVYRVLKICSNSSSLKNESNYLKSVAAKKNLILWLFIKLLKKFNRAFSSCIISKFVKIKTDNFNYFAFLSTFMF